jgi:hypothetical protein
MAQAATICDAAQFIVSDEPVENSLYFSSNSRSSTASDVTNRTRHTRFLQVEFPEAQIHAAVRLACNDFGDFRTIEQDAQSGCGLLKGSRGLPGVQHKAEAAHAFIIHDLGITENTGSRGRREPARLSIVKQERNVVKGCPSDVRGLMGSRPLLRIGGEIGLSTLGARGVGFSPGS